MVNPKYQIGQKVWRLTNQKAKEETIYGVVLTKEGPLYYISLEKGDYEMRQRFWISESSFFLSKDALISSL